MGALRSPRVLVDANVLFSRTVRDWLGLLYVDGEPEPFFVCWTEDILAEVMYHLRRKNPEWEGARIARIRDRIAATFEAGRVTRYEPASQAHVSDPDDRHVAGAALACGAEILLTFDCGGFVAQRGEDLPYEVLTPDDLFVLVDDAMPELVLACVEKQITYWSARGEVQIVESLREAGCPKFSERVLAHLRWIAQHR